MKNNPSGAASQILGISRKGVVVQRFFLLDQGIKLHYTTFLFHTHAHSYVHKVCLRFL